MKNPTTAPTSVVKATYFGNWGDIWGFPLAYKLLPYVSKVTFLTPNVITLLAFSLFVIGSLSLFLIYPFHFLVSAIFLPLAFLGDDLDGQIARYRHLSSEIGDYLDKTLDVLKIFIVTASLGYACFLRTHDTKYLLLGFIACFFFMFRYYIKLETVFHEVDKDDKYLEKSTAVREKRFQEIHEEYTSLNKTFSGKLKVLWLRNRLFFSVDEAEFACITGAAALFNQLELGLWFIAVAQVIIAIYRWIERGHQITHHSPNLLLPMRK